MVVGQGDTREEHMLAEIFQLCLLLPKQGSASQE